MQLILNNEDNVAEFLFDDDVTIESKDDCLVLSGSDLDLIISQFNKNTASIVADVQAPDRFYGGKYTYQNGEFTLVDGWSDPIPPEAYFQDPREE